MEALKTKTILRSTLSLIINNFFNIVLIVLIVAVPVEFIKNYFFVERIYEENLIDALRRDGIIGTVFLSIITPIIINFIHKKSNGVSVTIAESILVGVRKWPKVIVYGFVKNIIVIAGLILLVVPGVIFYFRLIFVDIIVTLEGTKGIDPIGKSNLMTKGYLTKIIISIISLVAVLVLPVFLVALIVYFINAGWLGDTIVDVVFDFVGTILLIQALVLYQGIQRSRENSE